MVTILSVLIMLNPFFAFAAPTLEHLYDTRLLCREGQNGRKWTPGLAKGSCQINYKWSSRGCRLCQRRTQHAPVEIRLQQLVGVVLALEARELGEGGGVTRQ